MTTALTEMAPCDSKTLEVACPAFITLVLSLWAMRLTLGLSVVHPSLKEHIGVDAFCWSDTFGKSHEQDYLHRFCGDSICYQGKFFNGL